MLSEENQLIQHVKYLVDFTVKCSIILCTEEEKSNVCTIIGIFKDEYTQNNNFYLLFSMIVKNDILPHERIEVKSMGLSF